MQDCNVVPTCTDIVFRFECAYCQCIHYFEPDEISAGFICDMCEFPVDIEPFTWEVNLTYQGIWKDVYRLLRNHYPPKECTRLLNKAVKKLAAFSKESLYKECLTYVKS